MAENKPVERALNMGCGVVTLLVYVLVIWAFFAYDYEIDMGPYDVVAQ